MKLITPLTLIVAGILLMGMVLGFNGAFTTLGGENLGPTDIKEQIIVDTWFGGDKYLFNVEGHTQCNQEALAIGWKRDQANVVSEAFSIDSASISIDTIGTTSGIFTYKHITVERYWYEYTIDGGVITSAEAVYGSGQPITNPTQYYTGWTFEDVPEAHTEFRSLQVPPDIQLTGNPEGILRATLYADLQSVVGDPLWTGGGIVVGLPQYTDHDKVKLAFWNAQLRSGEAFVKIGDAMPDLIEEGSDVEFKLKTGFTHSGGWTLFINPPNQEKFEYTGSGFTGQDDFFGVITYTIPYGWFTIGGNNKVYIELYSAYWMESITTFFVIDDIEKAPGPVTISYLTADYQAGEPIQFTISAVPNSITESPISYFNVWIYYGVSGSMPGLDFPSEYLVMDVDYPAENNQVMFTVTPTANRGDQVSVKVQAVDEDGRASLGEFVSMQLVVPGDGNEGGPLASGVDYGWTPTVLAVVFIIIAIFICLGIWYFGSALGFYRYILMIFTWLILVYLAWSAGTGGI